jgi:hypothetical protein
MLQRQCVVLSVAAALAILVAPAQAQVSSVLYGSGYQDERDTHLYLFGGAIRPAGLGWKPIATAEVFLSMADNGYNRGTLASGVAPGVGLMYETPDAGIGARVSYHVVMRDSRSLRRGLMYTSGERGVATSIDAYHIGFGPKLEGLATYQWGNDFIWTEAKAHIPVVRLRTGAVEAGAEGIWQGTTEDGQERQFLVGPSVRFAGDQLTTSLSAGWKFNTGVDEDPFYVRVGFSYLP